jgi:beta-glucanase (GH16 family)
MNARAIIVILAAAVQGGCAASPRPVAPIDLSYRLVWHDEFDGPALDPSKWSHYAPGPRRDAVNVPEAVSFQLDQGHSVLVITTSRHDEPGPDGSPRTEFRTGMISTRGLFEPTFGYFECRMKFQRQIGHWAAFWINTPTMGNPIGDPAAAGVEIDVIEYLRNGDYADKAQHAIHWDHKTPRYQRDFAAPVRPEIGEGYHVFACEWTPDYLAFFVDGEETWRTAKAIPKRPQHLILSLEIGKWADDIRKASLPDSLYVDYVRVYQRSARRSEQK